MKQGCKARCLKYLMAKPGVWVSKHHMVDLARTHGGYTGDQTSVRLRELEREQRIEKREDTKGYVEYRFTGESERKRLEGLAYFDSLPDMPVKRRETGVHYE